MKATTALGDHDNLARTEPATVSRATTVPAIVPATVLSTARRPSPATATGAGNGTNPGNLLALVLLPDGTIAGLGAVAGHGDVTSVGTVAGRGTVTILGIAFGFGAVTNRDTISGLGAIACAGAISGRGAIV